MCCVCEEGGVGVGDGGWSLVRKSLSSWALLCRDCSSCDLVCREHGDIGVGMLGLLCGARRLWFLTSIACVNVVLCFGEVVGQ